MKFPAALLGFCAFAISPPAFAAPLTRSTFTDVVKDVSVIAPSTRAQKPARVREFFGVPDVLRTGADSRAEMIAEDQTVTRVGANTLFSFEPERREVNLERGSILFHSPAGKGGGTIKTAAATASVLGTTLIVVSTKGGGFKVLLLEGAGRVVTPRGELRVLTAGQMTFLLPGQKLGPVIRFQLREQVGASKLVSGFKRPLPSMPKIAAAIAQQEAAIGRGKFARTGLLTGDSPEVGYQVDPNAREANFAEEQRPRDRRAAREDGGRQSRFRLAAGSDALVATPELARERIFLFGGTAEDAPELSALPEPRSGRRAAQGDSAIFVARNTTIRSPAIDLSRFEGRDGFQLFSAENLRIDGPIAFRGLRSTPLSLVAGRTILAAPGTVLSADTSRVELAAFGAPFELGGGTPMRDVSADGTPLRLTDFSVRNAGGDVSLFGPSIAFHGGALAAAGRLELAAPASISIEESGGPGRAISGGPRPRPGLLARTIAVDAGGELRLRRANLTAQRSALQSGTAVRGRAVLFSDGSGGAKRSFAGLRAVSLIDLATAQFDVGTVAMQARTINLRQVNFRAGSRVVLDSENGKLAPRPNSGQPSQPGFVNFIRQVTYGGAPAQQEVGKGITVK